MGYWPSQNRAPASNNNASAEQQRSRAPATAKAQQPEQHGAFLWPDGVKRKRQMAARCVLRVVCSARAMGRFRMRAGFFLLARGAKAVS